MAGLLACESYFLAPSQNKLVAFAKSSSLTVTGIALDFHQIPY